MTDQQILALAAKAHGNLLYIEDMDAWIHVDADGNRGAWWRPLQDNGDALALACNLRLDVFIHADFTVAYHPKVDNRTVHSHGNDPHAATRRAIVCAACLEKAP